MTYVLQTHNWFLFNDFINSLDYCLMIWNREAYFTVLHRNFPTGDGEIRENFHIISASKSKYETKTS
jgi:hypothetical protein